MKNKYEIRGEVTAIFIESPKYGNMETLIDTADLELVQSFPNTWCASYQPDIKGFYVSGVNSEINGKKTSVMLHRWIMKPQNDMQIDHYNHDGLNNKRSDNLRNLTNSENQQNKIKAQKNSKSGVLGVCWYKRIGKWQAQIKIKGKNKI